MKKDKGYFTFNDKEGKVEQKNSSRVGIAAKWSKPRYKVKFMHRGLQRGCSIAGFLRQFPGNYPQWNGCYFDFNVDCRDYDWLVVYQDLPPEEGRYTEEKLACPREKTMLITGEPSTITVFGRDYLRQFGCILSFQEKWAMPHKNVIFHHPGLLWHYGLSFSGRQFVEWDTLYSADMPTKEKEISTVCSQRVGKNTLHSARVSFTWRLKKELPQLDIYGHGVNPMDDKAEALDGYRFHIAVENHRYPHHLTEKLPDAFLGHTLPFYYGAPNAEEYFPKESFIPIDIYDYKRSKEVILYHLKNNEYDNRLPYIKQARKLVLEKQNLFAIINQNIEAQEKKMAPENIAATGGVIYDRFTMRLKRPALGLRSLCEKIAVKSYHRITAKKRQQPFGL